MLRQLVIVNIINAESHSKRLWLTGAHDDAAALSVHTQRGHEDDVARLGRDLVLRVHRGGDEVRLAGQRALLRLRVEIDRCSGLTELLMCC